LDHYVGYSSELTAPDWVNDDQILAEFLQPRSIIAETFVQLSMSDMNRRQVRVQQVFRNSGPSNTMPQRNLPALMVEWARAITVSFVNDAGDSIDITIC
jgi:hypothetical protein